jgi:hypothetical protein
MADGGRSRRIQDKSPKSGQIQALCDPQPTPGTPGSGRVLTGIPASFAGSLPQLFEPTAGGGLLYSGFSLIRDGEGG